MQILPILQLMKGVRTMRIMSALFDCPEGLTNITTLIKRSGPLCSKDCLISGFERAKDLRIFYALLRSLL